MTGQSHDRQGIEFGLDTRPGWRAAVAEGRGEWRRLQLRSAVRDDPGAAAEVLGDLGFSVAPPHGVRIHGNLARLTAF